MRVVRERMQRERERACWRERRACALCRGDSKRAFACATCTEVTLQMVLERV